MNYFIESWNWDWPLSLGICLSQGSVNVFPFVCKLNLYILRKPYCLRSACNWYLTKITCSNSHNWLVSWYESSLTSMHSRGVTSVVQDHRRLFNLKNSIGFYIQVIDSLNRGVPVHRRQGCHVCWLLPVEERLLKWCYWLWIIHYLPGVNFHQSLPWLLVLSHYEVLHTFYFTLWYLGLSFND